MKFTYIKFIFISLSLLIIIGSCEKEKILNIEDDCTKYCDTLPDDLIRWENTFIPQPDPDIPEIFIDGPLITGDQVVYVSKEGGLTGQSEEVKFISYDRFNGEEKWRTTISAAEMGNIISDMTSIHDQIIVFGEHLFLNINAEDGTVNAKRRSEDFPDRYAYKTVMGGKIYFTSLSGESDNRHVNVIACDLDFENWQTITTIEEKIPNTGNYLFFKGKMFYTNKDDDLIGIFRDGKVIKDYSQSTIIALNLTSGSTYQDRLLWKQQIQSPYDLALNRTPKIYKDSLLIMISNREIFGIDLKTGMMSYKVGLNRSVGLNLSGFPISGNKTILYKDHLMASIIDVRTGMETGTIDQITIPPSGIVSYDGLFYYVNGSRLVSLDPEGLQAIWSYIPQKRSSEIFGYSFPTKDGIAIDEENKLLYTTDNRYALCIKLPD